MCANFTVAIFFSGLHGMVHFHEVSRNCFEKRKFFLFSEPLCKLSLSSSNNLDFFFIFHFQSHLLMLQFRDFLDSKLLFVICFVFCHFSSFFQLATSCCDKIAEKKGVVLSADHQKRIQRMKRERSESLKAKYRFR